jgi:hypothetical protein
MDEFQRQGWHKMKILISLSLIFFASCTLSINLIENHGKAEDMIDETDSVTSEVSLNK